MQKLQVGKKPQITTTNLQLISELLLFEALANKKNAYYQGCISDKQGQELAKKHIMCHKTRYDALLSYLQSHC